jgi:hypothetical protein
MGSRSNRSRIYVPIIERIFELHYEPNLTKVPFTREEIIEVASALNVALPKNVGDIPYSFRYRAAMPASIRATAPEGKMWVIKSQGRSLYFFALVPEFNITPNVMLSETKIPDSTPGIVAKYAGGDEQALLARLRYNRLINIFTSVTSYSLQTHLRTTIPGIGQVETDELYVGVDRRGEQHIFPVQAKGTLDRLGVVQIEQDVALCAHRFPNLTCRPIAAQLMDEGVIALFELEVSNGSISIAMEKHYRLAQPNEIGPDDLNVYRNRSLEF